MLDAVRETWKSLIEEQLALYAKEVFGTDVQLPPLAVQTPPKPELGDLAFPLFAYAKMLRTAPPMLASSLKTRLEKVEDRPLGDLLVAGPYLNVRIDTAALATALSVQLSEQKELYGTNKSMAEKRVTIEFSCPNTNKPLHLGHMRNDSLGESVAAILKANGATVRKVNLINNRGVHICKSMLAYQKFGNGETPQSSGIKGDHLVGKYYVMFAQWAKEDPTAEDQAQEMLRQWEAGNEQVIELWKLMNGWTLDGLHESYQKMGISFDAYYYESETYKYGKDEILKGLEQGVFYREEDGSVWVDLEPIKLDKKVLLRKDGTSLYMTQDVGTAIMRHKDWPFDSLIYVVASEQQYHFRVLFYVLDRLGYDWAKDLHHLSYGMVNLPDGKMKSREGTVVDADELVDTLTSLARKEIEAKEREALVDDIEKTSQSIALGALNYYLLQVTPTKDMIFNPAESISFNGNTGPYLQYMGARISSMLRKYESEYADIQKLGFDSSLLTLSDERELIKQIALYPEVVRKAGASYDPSLLCSYLYDLSKLFSRWYHDNPVLKAATPDLVRSRIELATMVLQVLKNAFGLVGIPFLASM
ncbi:MULTISPECIES: arginine--tRNA ligase [unclassified Sphaerochaeta]|jgi:arginyl-tRNA synthetase|uniref:arginine--tRNA ligase n=1 Tax=unclassified Sphaerochaeta TaxID=2637943 RepID=UPI000AB28EAB|nr:MULTISPECIES: arginine--tRNA ligase [unclassified Sphaerochaeta]MCK9601905.1 arginine--tRNA ligase [Sphaerochaeta sp.]HCU31068.1 arginine--tRNA ligase [Sphaerochaeta sp.]